MTHPIWRDRTRDWTSQTSILRSVFILWGAHFVCARARFVIVPFLCEVCMDVFKCGWICTRVCQAICAPQCCTQVPFKICRQTLAPAVDIVWAQSYKSAGSDVFPFALNRTYTRTHEQTQTLHARSYTLTRNALQNTSQNTALRTSYVPCVATLDEERDCILHHYI